MNRKSLLFIICLTLGIPVFAQRVLAQEVDKDLVTEKVAATEKAAEDLKKIEATDKAWKFDGVVSLNAAATGLVNWAAGGINNINTVASAKLHLLYHKNSIAWETNFDTDFGLTWIDQKEDAFQKSSDNIKLATKFGWEFHKNWYLTALASFQSQYAIGKEYQDGYDQLISKWLAPSYTDISIGIDWKKEYNGANFSVYLSPIAGRISTAYVSDKYNNRYNERYQKAYEEGRIAEDKYNPNYDFRQDLQERYGTYKYNSGDEKEYKNFRAEFGLSIKGAIAYKYENLTLTTNVGLFTPYAWDKTELNPEAEGYFKYRDMNRRFGNFDVDWDFAISYQFLKVLNVSLSTSLKYYNGTLVADKNGNLAERVQFKSVLGIGIGYSF